MTLTAAALPRGLADAFHLAAGELGMTSASWLFVREIADSAGEAAVSGLRDALGRSYPVLDAVARAWLDGAREPQVNPEPVLEVCRAATKLVVVGVEARFLDVLAARLAPETRIVLLEESALAPDWARVRANVPRTAASASLSDFQRHAGRSSVLLTFGYGFRGDAVVHVLPEWLRVIGGDVRTQFRSIVLWNTLVEAPFVYPRWLSDAPVEDFTDVL